MKLTEIVIDDYGTLRNLRFGNLSPEFNLVYGGPSSGKTTVIRFIRNILFGFPGEGPSRGHIGVRDRDASFQLTRQSTVPGQLVAQVMLRETTAVPVMGAQDSEFVRGVLGRLNADLFDAFFNVRNRFASNAVHAVSWSLQNRLNVPAGRWAVGNDAGYELQMREIESRRARYEEIERRIQSLESQRRNLLCDIQQRSGIDQERVVELDRKTREVVEQINALDLQRSRESIARLDAEATELRAKIAASEAAVYAPAPSATHNSLFQLYQRLDEIDHQLARWRSVHADIQQQRVRLKDEMLLCNELTLESDKHPLHRSRNLLASLEQKVGQAELYAKQYHADIGRPAMSAENLANHVEQVCGQMREDIYALCNEMGQQYKSIRHRAAASELKQLRRCYTEMTENIKRLVNRRQSLIEQIGSLDPAGAEAIIRATREFCACAHHEGYLQARRRFAGELPIPSQAHAGITSDATAQRNRLRDIERSRQELSDRLAADENIALQWEEELRALNSQRDRLWNQRNNRDVEIRIAKLEQEIRAENHELQRLQPVVDQDRLRVSKPANELLAVASIFARRLTLGEIEKVWLTSSGTAQGSTGAGIEVENRHREPLSFEMLSGTNKEQVILSLCLAAVQHYARQGIRTPILLDDVFANLNPQSVDATIDLLTEFCDQGHQIIAMTSDRQMIDRVRNRILHKRIALFELPQTSVSPNPTWTPERTPDVTSEPPRTPEFLTPFTTRLTPAWADVSMMYPQVKYPPTGQLENHDAKNFETGFPAVSTFSNTRTMGPAVATPPVSVYPHEAIIDENTDLQSVDLVDSIHLANLTRNGIVRIGDLLNLTPSDLPNEIARAGFTREQIDRWQSQSWLMLCIPGLLPSDARILVASGITEPEQLDASTASQLQQRIQRYLATADGSRYVARESQFDINRIYDWYRALDLTRSQWRHPTGFSRHFKWERPADWYESSSAFTAAPGSTREPAIDQPADTRRPTLHAASLRDTDPISHPQTNHKVSPLTRTDSNLKFYLNLEDRIDAAPSIGPKTAERFEKIGVSTVGDFLRQTAESMATKIRYKRITANLIRQWQHQTRLVCRVPNLRGHDAQMLVACGITEPEDLAAEQPKRLFEIVARFADTKEGLKIIRSGKKPTLEEITEWIQWADHTRSLQAA